MIFSNIQSPLTYANSAVVAKAAAEEMLARLDWMALQPDVIVEVGATTGLTSYQLRKRYPEAHVLAIDASWVQNNQLKECQKKDQLTFVYANNETIPMRDQSVDLIFANLALVWLALADRKKALREWRRVLRPNGLLMFTSLGLDSLQEWRSLLADHEMIKLCDMHDLGDELLLAGFADPVLDVDYYTMLYSEKSHLFAELQASRMICADSDTIEITERAKLVLADEAGKWPVTYEVIYAHAFAPVVVEEDSKNTSNEIRIPLAKVRTKLPGKT